jgi:hypothetical protein
MNNHKEIIELALNGVSKETYDGVKETLKERGVKFVPEGELKISATRVEGGTGFHLKARYITQKDLEGFRYSLEESLKSGLGLMVDQFKHQLSEEFADGIEVLAPVENWEPKFTVLDSDHEECILVKLSFPIWFRIPDEN